MVRVLLIEVQAVHPFAWAEDWLSDHDLVAGDGRAADLVSYIRADETPHVGYLKVALSEMRDRTWVGTDGKKHAGTDMVGRLWASCLDQSLGENRTQSRAAVMGEVEDRESGVQGTSVADRLALGGRRIIKKKKTKKKTI